MTGKVSPNPALVTFPDGAMVIFGVPPERPASAEAEARTTTGKVSRFFKSFLPVVQRVQPLPPPAGASVSASFRTVISA